MTLKTLKDLELKEEINTVGNEIFMETIKEEAKKWMKQLKIDHPYESEDAVFTMDQYIKGQIDFIKTFFNLEEESCDNHTCNGYCKGEKT